jgi:hypothetical protein
MSIAGLGLRSTAFLPRGKDTAPVFISENGVSYGSTLETTNYVVPTPASTLENDLLLVFICINQSGRTVTAPAGWTAMATNSTNDPYTYTFYRPRPAGTLPDSYTFTVSGTGVNGVGTMLAYRGVDLAAPISANERLTESSVNSQFIIAPSATPITADTRLVGLWAWRRGNIANNGITGGIAFTQRASRGTAGGSTEMGAHIVADAQYEQLLATGNQTLATGTVSTANRGGAFVALKGGG